jgi:hypothetical protein
MATINDFVAPVTQLLGNRTDVAALVPYNLSQAVMELSNDYPFEELRETGPTTQFTAGVNEYPLTQFLVQATSPAPQHQLGKILSWYVYYSGSTGAGYNLQFRDMSDLEVLWNVTSSIPQFWSWLGQSTTSLYVAATPSQDYYTYCRYQYLHPFSTTAVGTDPVLLPPTWYDIINYATAERIALILRMSDVADRFHMKLFGDPKRRGDVGLIAARTSQTRKNQSRTTRSMRVMSGAY